MIELFFKGGPIFMGLLTIILLIVIVISGTTVVPLCTRKINISEETLRKINSIRSAGLLALVLGLLGQLIGLFSAFRAIKVGQIEASPILLAEGFKVSLIPAVYGTLIFIFSILVRFFLKKALTTFLRF